MWSFICYICAQVSYMNANVCNSCSKTRGMGAGRKLKTHRRNQRWADKAYKKSHLGNEWKKPFAGSSHAKGIVLEKMWDWNTLAVNLFLKNNQIN